jgi:aminopeptidase-like protein
VEHDEMVDIQGEIDQYLKRLFPLTRSLTGEGNRETLRILQEILPLDILEYPSGAEVYDWRIPQEWRVKDAWIKNSKGEKIVDFHLSNLHLVSYSCPIHETMTLQELEAHLHYLPELPDAIPYRTSYYHQSWGFCISHNQYQRYFGDDTYEVHVDSEYITGSMSLGELKIKGKSDKEYLISSYICHPSMANDSLSGVLVAAFLGRELYEKRHELEHSYRIVFIPETIGAIAYCSHHEAIMKEIKNGLVITTCGGPGQFGYKKSWDDTNVINALVESVFKESNIDFKVFPFDVRGSDERQYSSQTFRINCVTISKDKYYDYDYYHTSLDDLNFVNARQLEESLKIYQKLIAKMDMNIVYKSLFPACEVQLGKHDLYPKTGGAFQPGSSLSKIDIVLWLMFYLDGTVDLYTLSRKLGVKLHKLYECAVELENKNLIVKV